MRGKIALLSAAALGLAVTTWVMFAVAQTADEPGPAGQSAQTQPEALPSAGGVRMAILRAHFARMDRIERLLRNARVTARAGNVLAASEIDVIIRLVNEDQAAMRLYMNGIVELAEQRRETATAIERDMAKMQQQLAADGNDELAKRMEQMREQLKGMQDEVMPGFGRPAGPPSGQ